MATWEDGPEYAPAQRPASFDAPRVEPLVEPEPYVDISAGAPLERPVSYDTAGERQPELASIAVTDRHPRDPARPFDVHSSTMTAEHASAWGATHASVVTAPGAVSPLPASGFDPTRPFAVTPRAATGSAQRPATAPNRWAPPPPGTQPAFPGFGTPAWFGPAQPRVAMPPAAVTATDWFAAVTPIVFIAHTVGLATFWFLPVGPVAYLIGFCGSFLVRYRQPLIRLTGALLLGLQVFVAFIALAIDAAGLDAMWTTWNAVAGVSCGVHLALAGLASYLALRRRERPARRT